MKKKLAVLLVAVMAGTMFIGCLGGKKESAKDGGITIGVSMKDNSDEFVKRIANAIEEEGKAESVSIVMNDAEGDVNKQVSAVENMIAQNVDAIILNP